LIALHVLGYRVATAVVIVSVMGAVVGAAVAIRRRARSGPLVAVAWGMLVWTVLIVGAVTLAPSDSEGRAAGCGLLWSRLLVGWLSDDARLLNSLMYVPIGLLVAILVRSGKAVLVFGALVTPVLIEGLQSLEVVGRSCDAADVVDNWTGLAIGALLGALARVVSPGPSDADPTH
jgi:VanZ family protein